MAGRILLSKSRFKAGRECVRRMWFDQNEPQRRAERSEVDEVRIRDGEEVGRWARLLYPGGVTALYSEVSAEAAAASTRELMASGVETIFEATFVSEDRIVRCDVLRKAADGWIVDEVKASTFEEGKKRVKSGHVLDVAFQLGTLRACGVDVVGGGLVLLNRAYVWNGGEHDPSELFTRVDVTKQCAKMQDEIEREVEAFRALLAETDLPEAELNTHCKKCDYRDDCLAGLASDDLIFMTQARRTHVDKWRALGYRTIGELSEEEITDNRMIPTWRVIQTGQPWIGAGLGAALDEVVFPAAFIDFESCAMPVPTYAGTNPYEQICFQWSAHVLASADAEPTHLEFLQRDGSDPREEFCRTLCEAIRGMRTVVVYSAFEETQVRKMAETGVPFAEELQSLMWGATVDLEKLIAEQVCFKEFKYRTSIKTVLPALVPSMSYSDLAIGDGSAAMMAFRQMIDPATPVLAAEAIAADLRAYCQQDTLAMVEIYRALRRLVSDE